MGHKTQQSQPERCRAGIFFGGTFGMGGKNKRVGRLVGIQLIPTSVAADTLTECEMLDADWSSSSVPESRKRQLFHAKKNVDDGEGTYIPIDPPVKFVDGIELKTQTNCRTAIYVE